MLLREASERARAAGSATIEAEHLLLALAAEPTLRHLDLEPESLADALALEEERSLAAVGVFARDWTSPEPAARTPKLATSAKLAIQRAVVAARARGARRIDASHLLTGVLAAEESRVPRALRLAGIDADDLRARL